MRRVLFSVGLSMWMLCGVVCGVYAEGQVASTSGTAATSQVSPSTPAAYDGLWFCGFNLRKDLFSGEPGKLVRQAFNHAIYRAEIATHIVGDQTVPNGFIPPGMEGYDREAQGYAYDVKRAKALMRQAGHPPTDKLLKQLVLLHTDGVKTVKIAERLEKDLKAIGVKLVRKQIPYAQAEKWEKELKTGRFHLYLMGYKAEDPENVLSLLLPLFSQDGEANVGAFRNDQADFLLFQLAKTVDVNERAKKLSAFNQLLAKDPPVVSLFYITKLPEVPSDLNLEELSTGE